ncbi:MAG: hypothetical protein JEZ04_12255 [Spirochaetales bacterium]|nr:hypothetical protein [Spirochaetales bacterium]
MKRILLLFTLIIASQFVFAEEQNVYNRFSNALGGFTGETSGTGLSYQHWFGSVGVQAAAGYSYSPEGISPAWAMYNSTTVLYDLFRYDVGVEVLFMLYENSYSQWFSGNLYLFAGLVHTGALRYSETYTETGTERIKTGETEPLYYPGIGIGAGVGFEPVLFEHLSFPLEFGYGGNWEFDSIVPKTAGIRIQVGLRYRY